MEYKGYTIKQASQTGGKAGKGNNKTSTIQVRQELKEGYLLRKQIRYKVDDPEGMKNAVQKAKDWADDNPTIKV
jgi:hypothetical protein